MTPDAPHSPTSPSTHSPSASIGEPLVFAPILQERLWGGERLWTRLHKGRPGQDRMGESWELSDRPEAASVVRSGRFAGRSLRELHAEAGRALVGQTWHAGLAAFPLLYKFIDAREALSVQVHPGEGSPLGEAKTECWYVVEAPEGAELILGVSQALPREALTRALASSSCREVLRREPVKAGDLLFIPAGTVHAITEGLLIYELQQNSDTTFRLYDWDRRDASGKPRALHLEQAAQVMDLRVHQQHKIEPVRLLTHTHVPCIIDVRVACPFFALWHWHDFKGPAKLTMPDRMRVATVVGGRFSIEWPGNSVPLELGETVLFPADLPEVLLVPLDGACELLVSSVPDLETEVKGPLLRLGHEAKAIAALGGVDGF